jgi:hypothetical protein
MQNELKKLAAVLREAAKTAEQQHHIKCAQVVQASIALELLRRKIGG